MFKPVTTAKQRTMNIPVISNPIPATIFFIQYTPFVKLKYRKTSTSRVHSAMFKGAHSHPRCSYIHIFADSITILPEKRVPVAAMLLSVFTDNACGNSARTKARSLDTFSKCGISYPSIGSPFLSNNGSFCTYRISSRFMASPSARIAILPAMIPPDFSTSTSSA